MCCDVAFDKTSVVYETTDCGANWLGLFGRRAGAEIVGAAGWVSEYVAFAGPVGYGVGVVSGVRIERRCGITVAETYQLKLVAQLLP